MNLDQKKFLQGRLRKAASDQPELRKLKSLLLSLGGEFIVPPSNMDIHLPELLSLGFVMNGPILQRPMRNSMCHQNIAAVWKKGRKGLVGIGTGYGLSDDGLWRQHSWGMMRDGLLESTVERQKYFGILLQGPAADFFASNNQY